MLVQVSSNEAAWGRLTRSYLQSGSDWPSFYKARFERGNFASRYHFVYPSLAMHLRLRRSPAEAEQLRPMLEVMYGSLIDPRCWMYWHEELNEPTGAISERNLTYAARLAVFVGLYIDAFGDPPAVPINVDGETVTYSQISERLWRQMVVSPSCGVSCYHHQSMVPCNAALMINNRIHDRLFGSNFSEANERWMETVRTKLEAPEDGDTLFFYGTEADSPNPLVTKRSLGMDAWSLFLMSGIAPDAVKGWFERWRHYIQHENDCAWIPIPEEQAASELASIEWATAWAMCLAAELGEAEAFRTFDNFMAPMAVTGFRVDPYLSGLYALAHELRTGSFYRLVEGGCAR